MVFFPVKLGFPNGLTWVISHLLRSRLSLSFSQWMICQRCSSFPSLDFNLKELPGHDASEFCAGVSELRSRDMSCWIAPVHSPLQHPCGFVRGASYGEGRHRDTSSGHLSLGFIQKICRKRVSTGSTSLNLVQAGSVFSDMTIDCIYVSRRRRSNSEVIFAWLASWKRNHGAVWALGLKAAEPD